MDGYAVIYAWEFHGCFFHGCPRCMSPVEISPLKGVTYGELHAASEERLRILESEYGVRTIVMREHE